MTQAEREMNSGAASTAVAPLIAHNEESCTQCWSCVRHCPSRAIKVIDGKTEIIEERCVKCGLCVSECAQRSQSVRDDVPRVRSLLATGVPVVALVASEYFAALHPLSPDEVERRLLAVGFTAIETTVLGEELVATAYELVHSRNDAHLPSLRSTCPVVVDWVRKFYPQLTAALAPIIPAYVAHARLIRELYPDDTAVVYVSPCWARKDEVLQPEIASHVDVAIGFDEFRAMLDGAPDTVPLGEAPPRPRAIKQLSVTDGFPRRTLTERTLADGDIAVSRGLHAVDEILSAIVRGETAPAVVDMLHCEGCLDGPCVNADMSVFAKRAIDLRQRSLQPPPVIDSRTLLAALPSVAIRRTFTPEPVCLGVPTSGELALVLQEGEFETEADFLNCGACGYSTCNEHAVAIWEGASSWEICFPLQRKRLIREREQFAQAAVSDVLTGLLNRREFDRRIAEEVARATRYSTPLSLVMVDVDRFKDINDTLGHVCGDALLRAVGVLLKSELRIADAAARFGGDEFALILPNTGKTEAWAVAEKVRLSVSSLTVHCDNDCDVSTTVSLGIAALSEQLSHANDLLDAADRALYKAKRSGRNRVELSAG